MPKAENPEFSETDVTFTIKERLGWNDSNVFPQSVYIEHDCDKEKSYSIGNRTFYDRQYVRYAPERTCRNVCSSEGGFTCSECGAHISGGADYCHSFVNEGEIRVYTTANEPSWHFCPNCGAKVVDE